MRDNNLSPFDSNMRLSQPCEIREKTHEIEEFTELGDCLQMPTRTCSSGMQIRLGFAVSTCFDPEILLMDEWITAGDARFLDKARHRMESFIDRCNILVLATHSRDIARDWCNKSILMDDGQIVAAGSVDEVWARYVEINQAP